ncbi:MAG: TIGR00730 family Rossman fold protein [Bacteroidales bacterium]
MEVVVYCSSRGDMDRVYLECAECVAEWIGRRGDTLVYGGADAGMMHIVACGVARYQCAGIIGVIPENMRHRADKVCDELILVKDLAERKSVMIVRGELFIALPGSIGTADELISTLAQFVVAPETIRPVIVVNVNGVFDTLLAMLSDLSCSIFANKSVMEYLSVVNSKDELIEQLNLHIS